MNMQNTAKNFFSLTIICAMLASCTMNKQGGGALLGAVAGGLIGSQVGDGVGTMVGAAAGAVIGSAIGKSLDDKDKALLAQTSQNALEKTPTGHKNEWRNPDSGHYGYVEPTKTYQSAGRYCREYVQTVFIGGEKQQAYGRACRGEDGHWRIVE